MRVHFLQHVSFEGPANVGAWAASRGYRASVTRLYEGEVLPDLGAFDLLAVMGGPMNIYEHERHPWLEAEKAFLHRCCEAGKAVLGVCLGAQLLANVLGGRVISNGHREIGWFPVSLTDEADGCSLLDGLPRRFTAFHWHGDQLHVPPRGRLLARNEACPAQAFCRGDRLLGLQFHLDYSAESIDLMLDRCAEEVAQGGPFVQSARRIRERMVEGAAETRALLETVLDNLARAVS